MEERLRKGKSKITGKTAERVGKQCSAIIAENMTIPT